MRKPASVAILFLLLLLYVTALERLPGYQEEKAKAAQLAAVLSGSLDVPALGEKTKSHECAAIGPLPDPECTPGAVFTGVTREQICVSGYSKSVRNVSQAVKKKIFATYGIAYPVPFGSYEIDHLIPLSLGGSNEYANLWPKSAEPYPGFFEKNVTGNFLVEQVCAGRVDLEVAQEAIANDWYAIYQSIPEADIARLKAKYGNWAKRGN